MIIIDEYADTKLVEALADCQRFGGVDTGMYIHFKLARKTFEGLDIRAVHDVITTAVEQHLDAANPTVYLCENGDVYVVLLPLPRKYAHALMQEVASRLKVAPDETFVSFEELEIAGKRLLADLLLQIEKRRIALATLKRQYEEEKDRRLQQTLRDDQALSTQPH